MTDQQAARIKLAEAMGWRFDAGEYIAGDWDDEYRWTDPQGRKCTHGPDPFTDANDCDALRQWLNDAGWWIIINIHKNRSCHLILGMGISDPQLDWNGNDWMHGVCELALKVIDSKQESDDD